MDKQKTEEIFLEKVRQAINSFTCGSFLCNEDHNVNNDNCRACIFQEVTRQITGKY